MSNEKVVMTWKEITDEILRDIIKAVAEDIQIEYMVGLVQWEGKLIASPVYQPTPLELTGARSGFMLGMNIIVKPESWKPIDLKFVPKVNGQPTAANMPVAYFIIGDKGHGVAFPARFNDEGKINWSHNPDIIDLIQAALMRAGLYKEKVAQA